MIFSKLQEFVFFLAHEGIGNLSLNNQPDKCERNHLNEHSQVCEANIIRNKLIRKDNLQAN